jgi:hypothetical protein
MHHKDYLPLASNILIFQFGQLLDIVLVKPEVLFPKDFKYPCFNYKLAGQKNQGPLLINF